MKLSYDYEDMIYELMQEIDEGLLSYTDHIQIKRGEERFGYAPIVDWYYNDETMTLDNTPNMYTSPEVRAEMAAILADYLDNQPYLIDMTVAQVLSEMTQMNKLF